VTKARDNRLIKLTRELALYLMLKQSHGSQRGLVVYVHYYEDSQKISSSLFLRYVDKQLRHSKRFDAEGIQRDHPELFVPFPQRRTSSSLSLSSLSSNSNNKEDGDEGQLRYWTSSMCSHSSHLFDFVVTVSVELVINILLTPYLARR
jgi:NAD+ kinase